ncbi:GAF domain-containing protein, partial [Silvibacterium sp.]|uniref:GAF domain-containing protein n=1 Tax=Silvibacterium sp. TaxID=1964179 RepID=UPI0039E424A1
MPNDPTLSHTCSWHRRYERERHARLASEALAEQGLHDLYNNKQLLELAGSIAIKANEATTVDDALLFALKRVCEATGWILGHAYMVTGNPPLLAPTKLWFGADGEHLREFREITERSWFQKGRGLAGRVLETGTPSWLPNVLAHSDIARKRVAARCGLTAAVAFPILAGTEVAGVLEFFLDQPR